MFKSNHLFDKIYMNIIEKYNPFFKLATRNPSARVTSETFISDSMYFI